MRPCASVAGTRCTRCPPDSNFQPRVRAFAHQPGDHFLVAAEVRRRFAYDLHLPALAFGKARVHAQQVAGEEGRFITARAGADFHEDVAVVVRIFRQQQALQFAFERRHPFARGPDLVFGKGLHVGIGQQLLGGGDVFLGLLPRCVLRNHGLELGVLARELAVLVEIGGGVFAREQRVDFDGALGQLVELGQHAGLHSGNRERGAEGGGRRGPRMIPRHVERAAAARMRGSAASVRSGWTGGTVPAAGR